MKLFIVSLWLATVFTVLAAVSPDVNAAIIGHWAFDEGGGTTAYDSSGNELNGTITGATYTAGKIGSNALFFNGQNSFVEVLDNLLLTPKTIGISLWFKASDPYYTDYFDILDKGHGAGSDPYYAGYVIQGNIIEDNQLLCAYGHVSGFPEVHTDFSLWDNNWHHLAVNLGENGCQLYLDGEPEDSIPSQGPLIQNDSNLYFGRHRTLGRYFLGSLDDIRLYDGALSQSQVSALFIPEPATIALLAIGALALLRRKK